MVWQHRFFYYQSKSTYYKAQFYKGISLIVINSFFYIVQIANIYFLPSFDFMEAPNHLVIIPENKNITGSLYTLHYIIKAFGFGLLKLTLAPSAWLTQPLAALSLMLLSPAVESLTPVFLSRITPAARHGMALRHQRYDLLVTGRRRLCCGCQVPHKGGGSIRNLGEK